MTTEKPLHEQTPIEIDTQLAEYYVEAGRIRTRYESNKKHLDYLIKRGGETPQPWDAKDIQTYTAKTEEGLAQLRDLAAKATPLEVEHDTRQWSRAFLVVASNGHVHKSMYCSTTFPTTQWEWLPEYSGKDEAQIIEDAGERACTICWPAAPTSALSRPTRIFSRDEKAAAERRVEREQKAAEKAAKKAATTVVHPDGLDLYGPWDQVSDNARQVLSGAVGYVADQLSDKARPEYAKSPEKAATRDARLAANTEALAQFNRITIEHQQKIIREKALAKHIKDGWTGATRYADELKALRAELRALKN